MMCSFPDAMIHVGQPTSKCLEIACKLGPLDLRHRHVPLKPSQYLAVEAAAIPPRALLEFRVELRRNVLEGKCEHGLIWNRNGTIFRIGRPALPVNREALTSTRRIMAAGPLFSMI